MPNLLDIPGILAGVDDTNSLPAIDNSSLTLPSTRLAEDVSAMERLLASESKATGYRSAVVNNLQPRTDKPYPVVHFVWLMDLFVSWVEDTNGRQVEALPTQRVNQASLSCLCPLPAS